MENNQAYIEMLINSLKIKGSVLDEVIKNTKEQEQLLDKGSTMDMDEFDGLTEEKGILIDKVNDLNQGFEILYDKIKDTIELEKNHNAIEIVKLQELIKIVVEKSVNIQALEKRNYIKFEWYVNAKKNEIRNFKMSSKTVNSYYKNMAEQHQGQSFFLDKKK